MKYIYIVGAGGVGKATRQGFAGMGHSVPLVDVVSERMVALRAEGPKTYGRIGSATWRRDILVVSGNGQCSPIRETGIFHVDH